MDRFISRFKILTSLTVGLATFFAPLFFLGSSSANANQNKQISCAAQLADSADAASAHTDLSNPQLQRVPSLLPREDWPTDFNFYAPAIRSLALKRFRSSPRLLMFDETPRPEDSGEFYFSNESDWYRARPDYSPKDVVIGFGTTNAWDLAVRHDAKMLVIADWENGPLQAQEMIFRPLLLASRTPAEFLSLLFGVPMPADVLNAGLEKVFHHIEQWQHDVEFGVYGRQNAFVVREMLSDARAFISKRLKEILAAGLIDDEQFAFLRSYYWDHMEYGEHPDQHWDVMPPPTIRGSIIVQDVGNYGPVSGKRAAKRFPFLLQEFKLRYSPTELINAGADPLTVLNPFFSFLSSQQAFERLQRLFMGGVHYAGTSVDNLEFYRRVKALADERSLHDYTISTVNIFDCATYDFEGTIVSDDYLRAFLKHVVPLFASDAHALTVMQTRNVQFPHNFENMSFKNADEIDRVLERSGHEIREREPLSRFFWAEYIVKSVNYALVKGVPLQQRISNQPGRLAFQLNDLAITVQDGHLSVGIVRFLGGSVERYEPTIDTAEDRVLVMDVLRKILAPQAELHPALRALYF